MIVGVSICFTDICATKSIFLEIVFCRGNLFGSGTSNYTNHFEDTPREAVRAQCPNRFSPFRHEFFGKSSAANLESAIIRESYLAPLLRLGTRETPYKAA